MCLLQPSTYMFVYTFLMLVRLGGIRCVKINAYLEQKLGFQNVSRLEGGIIAYTRELETKNLQGTSAAVDDVAAVHAVAAVDDVAGIAGTPNAPESFDMIEPQQRTDGDADALNQRETEAPQDALFEAAESKPDKKSENKSVLQLSSPHLTRHVSESKFRGVNYVFDDRMGATITSDTLGQCETCGTPCSHFTNCR